MSDYLSKHLFSILAFASISGVSIAVVALATLRALYRNIRPLPPTTKQLEEEPWESYQLFRYLPQLQKKVAWRQIGNYPTPIHKCQVGKVSFYVKREDLSSELYGGNKVRTLQHQLASCEAHKEEFPKAKFVVLGSGGSNQAVAAVVHGRTLGIAPTAAYPMSDPPDMDNAINMLSVLSFPVKLAATPLKILRAVVPHLFSKTDKIFNLGGNNVSGVLGQIGGALEFAEQIQAGEIPDPDAIYVAAGSNCTSIGLTMGIAIARRTPALNKAFRNPNFKLVVVPIHHVFAGAQRITGLFKNPVSKNIPLMPLHGMDSTCEFIVSCGGPNLKKESIQTFHEVVEYFVETDYIGQYGEHSKESIKASKAYDQDGKVLDLNNNPVGKGLWLCGHFSSKPVALLLDRLNHSSTTNQTPNVVFWQTKSAVVPKGPVDEYARMKELTMKDSGLAKWFFEAKAHSSLRPGSVSPNKGAETYQSIMTAAPDNCKE